ncbi:WD40 repeat-like protein [Schizopora paradoxa]|uniref:WD40 repeat-like protein n=1 Tax=Schizopora paradoxa TaxID=27342 RepID=A0A0H2R8Y6_9AGAM|nr:WD40 repeat-like protein [Schizopora paradoxa]
MSDLGKHIAIQKNICIQYGDAKKLSKSDGLQVLLGDLESITVANPEKVDSLTRRWTLDSEILLFPGDIITFRVLVRKKRSLKTLFAESSKREGLQEYQITYEVVIKEFRKLSRSDASTIVAFTEDGVVLTLELLEGNIERIIEMASEKDMDPLLPERVKRLIDSSDTLWRNAQNAQSLQSVLENLPVGENAYQVLENTIATLGNVHPLAKAILTALAIPYKILKTEVVYKQKIKDMAETMRVACRCLMETRYHTKIAFAKDVFESMLRLLRNAAVFIDIYCKMGRIRQVIGAQFPDKLDAFSKDLIKQKNDFQIAMILQISGDVDSTASISADIYLQRRLSPVTQDPLGEGCLAETRKHILDQVRKWLVDNSDTKKNIMWIVGAPGAGKTTIATSITKELRNRPYAKFFAKRDKSGLSDARRICPSIACSLAEKHDGMKAALMLALRDDKNTEVRDFSVSHQFENFFKGPLEMDFKETGSRSSEVPVVIIDALDECYSRDSSNWDSLLESLAGWPKNSKLIITSRYHYELPDRPSETYDFIDLATGLNAPEENKNDIQVFFTIKFTQMRSTKAFRIYKLPQEWPRREEIEEMTAYAVGLFIWADMAVKYIEARDDAGNDPVERLQNVLDDIRDEGRSRIKGENRVDNLYARIIFEAFPRQIRDERERAKKVLATILLAKEPFRKEDLIELMSPQISCNTVMSTLSKLNAIIPSSDHKLRVCHKSISDFALSRERSMDALLPLVPRDHLSYIIDVEEENKELALACLRLMSRKLSRSSSGINGSANSAETFRKQAHSDSFSYLWQHWIGHLEDAGSIYHALLLHLKSLQGAMEVAYGRLERFSGKPRMACIEAVALIDSVRCSIDLAVRCIDTASHEESDIEALQYEVIERAKSLDIVRGHFQIAAVLQRKFPTVDNSSADRFLRRQLAPADHSSLDDECLPGTRTAILSEAENWLENSKSPNILWISGAPGAGKSAIATSLVRTVFPRICLCAKVFAKRDFADRRDPSLVWRTLIYDLASLSIGLRGSVMEAVLEDSLSNSGDQTKHCDLMFRAISDQQYLPVVAVIDALDECFMEDNAQWKELLDTVCSSKEFPQSFKLVVTSRNLYDIRGALSDVSYQIVLPIGTETLVQTQSDIEIFLRSKLANVPQASSYWLSEDVLSQLVDHAAGSFIWAKMVVGLVELNPEGCLGDIVTGEIPGSSENVDILYAKVLKETLGQLLEEERGRYRAVLSTIVCAREPLQMGFLETLPINGLNSDEVCQSAKKVFEDLRSIITVDENMSVRIPHKLFTDFFLDEDRCSNAMGHLNLSVEECCTYLIQRQDSCATLAIACLNWMNNNLVFNTYRISTLHLLNKSLQELEVEHIDFALVYACRYWGEHLGQANMDDSFYTQAHPLLRTFFHHKALFWLEILSLAKAVSSAEESLRTARNLLEGYDNDLAVFAGDVLEFVMDFEDPITAAASHIYISALPFSPSNSQIFQVYAPQFPNLFSVSSGRREDWGVTEVTGNGHNGVVRSLSSFREGSRLASASFDQTVRIWDSKTGEAISTSFKHCSDVLSMTVSPDGKLIASGNYKGALSIWDSKTGTRKLNLADAHSGIIHSVAFLPSGFCVVTGSKDNMVKVWDIVSGGLCLEPLTGHTNDVNSVAFSPNGTLIASGSDDYTVRIWDATTGKSHREPLIRHTSSVLCLAFTEDGHYLASGSLDYTFCLWNVMDGFTQTSFINSGIPVYSISFSPKSKILVSGHDDGFLRFWDIKADGLSLASGSNDKSIKIWAMPTAITLKASHVEDKEKPQYVASNLDQL